MPQSGGPPVVPPMICALEALARLQGFHIEQGPDLMIPPIGWTLVTEKGNSSVYKKLVPQISEVFPVYRADRVIEGVTAEEMVSVLSAFSTRPAWDDRIESSSLIECYGNGCSTLRLTTKPNFPFKGRTLQLSHLIAQMQVPSSSIGSSMSTVHFIASSSFARPTDSGLSNLKLNPQNLVEGNVFLEGWIMETIDPYSVSFHAIPSTRCTYFTAIDYRGSLPVALNSMLNSSLPRLISGVEKLVKRSGPLPMLSQPCLGLVVDGSLGNDGIDELEWRLKNCDRASVALTVDAVGSETFTCTVLLKKGSNELKPTIGNNGMTNCTPVNGTSNTLGSSRYDVVRHLRGLSSTVGGNHEAVVVGGNKSDVRRLVSNPDLRRKTSVGQLRRSGVNSVPNAAHHHHNNHMNDRGELVVMEISIDRKLYPNGFRVDWKSEFVKEDEIIGLESTHQLIQTEGKKEEGSLPMEVSIHEMPSPAVFSASLDTKQKREHLLLRMVLDVKSIHCPLKDPLTNPSDPIDSMTSHLPSWYTELSQKNALVKVWIGPVRREEEGKGKKEVVECNGKLLGIVPIGKSQCGLDRWEIDDYVVTPCSISRMMRSGQGCSTSTNRISLIDTLPNELKRPLAIGMEFLSPVDLKKSSSPQLLGTDFDGSSPRVLSPVLDSELVESEVEHLGNGTHGTHKLNHDESNSNQTHPTFSHHSMIQSLMNIFQKSIINPIMNPTTSRTYRSSEMIWIGLISFFLGSLLRSLILPHDFVLFPLRRRTGNELEDWILEWVRGRGVEWREVVRVLEIRVWGAGWSLVLAAVKDDD